MTEGYSRIEHELRFKGPIFSLYSDKVELPGGTVVNRDVVENMGAVGVVALDASDRVALIRQYRHAVGAVLWELPAGLLDVPGEAPEVAAARELAEEADLVAGSYERLVELHTSPGFASEKITLFLARDLTPVPDEQRHQRTDEEAGIELSWIPLPEAVRMVLAAEITNAAAVGGILAAATLAK